MVKCGVCGTENPDGARYCMNCGSPLMQGVQPYLPYAAYYQYYLEYWRWYYNQKKMEEIRKRKSLIAISRVLIMVSALCILTSTLMSPLLSYTTYTHITMYSLIIGTMLGLFAGFLGLYAGIILEGRKESELWIASSAAAAEFVASFYISTWVLYSPMALLCIPAIVLSFVGVIILASGGYNIIEEKSQQSSEVYGNNSGTEVET